jgi:hypothetical protein
VRREEDEVKKNAEIECLWFDDEGRGPWIPKIAIGVFKYPTPGPDDHVGIQVPGFGGGSLDVARAREVAAAINAAADEAEAANKAGGK